MRIKKRSMVALIVIATLITVNFGAGAAEPAVESLIQSVPDEVHAASDAISISESSPASPSTDPPTPVSVTPVSQIDLWERIRNGFAMAELDSEEVRNNEDFYISQPGYMKLVVERAKRYLFHIVEEVERRGMPAEIALLPFIESAFNPRAYSSRHASGIWQLIPSTGKNYGLKQNWWYDERRDIVAATRAALDHLQNLYRMFGDWELALASYNWGEGAVGRSLMKNRNNGLPADFRNISLPPETQNYVPKLIAVKNIISNPAIFGIELESVPNQPYFSEVATNRHMDVKLAAKLANISLDEFKALNPAHNRPVINVDGPRALLFPVDKVEVFEENLRNHDKSLLNWQAHEVKKGETAEDIAARYGISVRRLKEINDVAKTGTIVVGQVLLVPRNGTAVGADISVMRNMPSTRKIPEDGFIYTVRKGDALWTIARSYGVTVAQIKSWNGNTERLRIGDKLILKHMSFPAVLPASEKREVPVNKRM